ncbi:GNAT family N-acetyltransferase [Paenibacillus typhae]|uniref:GNAT family N-acetyltransferase n=1 Tax=Paenibacillus typhae TaxID=1174501 RepID=UPI001C8DF548|nr:GNAT family N-acetyltransferase [Paenibacillus typhae]MBY0011856.1 GNAT family N-acetyltransferase [Paenibacillus typhae]
MTYTYRKDRTNIDWTRVTGLLNGFGLTDFTPAQTERAFVNSAVNVFVFDGDTIIGCGRALSDGISQAAVYNIAVDGAYHHQGLGKKIIALILEETAGCNVVLYTHPDTVSWYEEQGFRRMKTGLALYHPDRISKLAEMGFI